MTTRADQLVKFIRKLGRYVVCTAYANGIDPGPAQTLMDQAPDGLLIAKFYEVLHGYGEELNKRRVEALPKLWAFYTPTEEVSDMTDKMQKLYVLVQSNPAIQTKLFQYWDVLVAVSSN